VKISREMKEETTRIQPLPSRISISRTEMIQHLQTRCENPREKVKLAPVRTEKVAAQASDRRVSEEALLFESIEKEIAERQTFLEEMRFLGQGSKHEAVIKGEIAERVRELKRLDAMLRAQ